MNAIQETVPTVWSETDERYFRVVAEVFSVTFLFGASTLLASYDVDPSTLPSHSTAPAQPAAAPADFPPVRA